MSNELDLTILKNLITNKKHALDFINECDTRIFNTDVWNFANIVVSYVRTYKDVPTLRVIEEKLSKGGGNDKLVESVRKVWDQLDRIAVKESEYKFELEKIKKRFAEKQITLMQEMLSKQESGTMDVSKAIAEMQKTIQTIKGMNEAKTYERKTLRNNVAAFQEKFNAKRTDPQVDVGLKTGYSFFDYSTNGIKPADFVIIAGESGFGKSLFLMNMAVQSWLQGNTIDMTSHFKEGRNIVYFSLEMPYEDCFNRLLSRLSGVASRKLDNPNLYPLEPEEFVKVREALKFIKEYPYEFEIVDIADASANDLDLILNDIQYSIDAIFVDYLGIMKPNEKGEEQDWLKQGIIAYETRGIARKRNLPIFSAVQLNRKAQSKDSAENIGLSRLARSATIATHATQVIQIENRVNEENFPDFIYHLIKNRKGPKGKGRLIKNLACATLLDEVSEQDTTTFEMRDIDDISEKIELLEI
jgi:replicative DNA helicase